MKVTLEQVSLLNRRIGDIVYSLDTQTGLLVAAPLSQSRIIEDHLDDLIDLNGNLTPRARKFAREILEDN